MTAPTSDDVLNTVTTKREFLSLVGAAAALAGTAASAQTADAKPYDIIVVGGGTAGLPLAIFAAARKAKVLIVETAGTVGGTLFLSGGMISAAGTKLQKSKGIVDTPQQHYDDIMKISRGTADPDIVRLDVENAGATFDWLVEQGMEVPAKYPITGPPLHDPYSVPRYATGPDGGRSILATLEKALKPHVDAGRIVIKTQHEVTALIQDDKGRVVGVEAKDQNDKPVKFMGKNVALTSGGYSANPKMVAELEGRIDYCDNTYPHSQGAGIKLGLQVGGWLRGGEKHVPLFGALLADDDYPSPLIGSVRHYIPDRPPWEIMVNKEGERFLEEDTISMDAYEQALNKQTGERCWMVFDDVILREAPKLISGANGGWTKEQMLEAFHDKHPMFPMGNTVEELAEAAGIHVAGLVKTVADYNEAQKTGQDKLGRKFMPKPIVKAPFYAVRLHGYMLITFAGLAVDKDLRVIRKDKTPIEGLYAAGELLGTGQLMGKSYCGGMTVTPSLTFGRLLGQKIIKI